MRSASIVLAALAIELLALAFAAGGCAWALLWPAMALMIAAFAYGTGDPTVFGKVESALRLGHRVVLLPYLAIQTAVWHAMRLLSQEDSWNQLTDDLVIGRRLLPDEYPPGLASIVDLTCEFPELLPRYGPVVYLNFPILDGGCPSTRALAATVDQVLALPRPVYIHCAQGHGRTAMVASALLTRLQLVDSVEGAIARVLAVRPRAKLKRSQRSALNELFDWNRSL